MSEIIKRCKEGENLKMKCCSTIYCDIDADGHSPTAEKDRKKFKKHALKCEACRQVEIAQLHKAIERARETIFRCMSEIDQYTKKQKGGDR